MNIRVFCVSLEGKHCVQPNYDAVLHGNISSIESMHDDLGLLTYATTVTYTCDKGYELSDGTKEQKSFCLQSNEWSSLGQVCTSKFSTEKRI